MTRGLAEITRLGVKYFGAKPMTFPVFQELVI